jgi:hypothetical protein
MVMGMSETSSFARSQREQIFLGSAMRRGVASIPGMAPIPDLPRTRLGQAAIAVLTERKGTTWRSCC